MAKQAFLVQFTPPNEFYPTRQSPAFSFEEALEMAQGDVELYNDLDWVIDKELTEDDVLNSAFGYVYAESNEGDTVSIVAVDEETAKDWEDD